MLEFTAQDRKARRHVLKHGKRDGNEHIYVYDAKIGERLGVHTSGKKGKVRFPVAVERHLSDPKRELVAHHNHPTGGPPSAADINGLWRNPGLASVWVHTADGCSFRLARAGSKPNPAKVIAFEDHARIAVNGFDLRTAEEFNFLVHHVACLALVDAGHLSYFYRLTPSIDAAIRQHDTQLPAAVQYPIDATKGVVWGEENARWTMTSAIGTMISAVGKSFMTISRWNRTRR